jgi:hypothetical protein
MGTYGADGANGATGYLEEKEVALWSKGPFQKHTRPCSSTDDEDNKAIKHVAQSREAVRQMELYLNTNWTGCYANAYIAEAIAWSAHGNHATIYTTGSTAEETQTKLVGALGELNLLLKTTIKGAR